MRRRILLFDVFSLLYRAHHALPPMNTTGGEPTSALYGLAALLVKLLREERPAGGAFALDGPWPTFRHLGYAAYKGTRQAAPEPGRLAPQLARLPALLAAFGWPSFAVPPFEADDVVATLARELREAGDAPLAVSGDNDLLQCATGGAEVLIVSRGAVKAERYDADAVRARFGVPPERLADRTALVGDPSDNLPGVPGVGPRTAARLLARFDTLAGVLAHLDEVEPAAVRESLRAHAERLPLWFTLATLRDDVPLGPGPRWAPFTPEARARVEALFEELEFRSLVPRLRQLPPPEAATRAAPAPAAEPPEPEPEPPEPPPAAPADRP